MKESRKAKTEMQRAKDMKAKQRKELLGALKARFEQNLNRHKGLALYCPTRFEKKWGGN
jgi:hypothetical protein